MIYGPDYTEPENISRLRQRNLGHKRSLALREYALGLAALDRVARGEPLWRVHECVFGELALESEPVDPGCRSSTRPTVVRSQCRYGTDGSTHEGVSNFDAMWEHYHDLRTGMYVTTVLWAGLFLVQAAGTALIVRNSDYSTGYTYDQTLPLAAVGVGVAGSVLIGRYFTSRGRTRGPAHAVHP